MKSAAVWVALYGHLDEFAPSVFFGEGVFLWLPFVEEAKHGCVILGAST